MCLRDKTGLIQFPRPQVGKRGRNRNCKDNLQGWADRLRFLSPANRNGLGLPALSVSFYPPFLLLQA